jgi:TonB family protein
MSDRNKNKKSLLSDFIRYQKDQLSAKERNSFERELQRDNFAREASEGFTLVSGEDAMKDLTDLQNRLKTRTARKQRILIYRIAASIAILMMISTLFVFIGKNRSGEKLADNSIQPYEFKITKNRPLTEPISENRSEIQPAESAKKSDKRASAKVEMNPSAATGRADRPVKALNHANDSLSIVKSEAASLYASDERKLRPVNISAKDRSQSPHNATGIILSSEDNQPLPGVNVHIKGTSTGVITDMTGKFSINLPDSSGVTLIADYIGMVPKEFSPKADTDVEIKLDPSEASLSEVVVTAYGINKYDSAYEETAPGHTPPQPSVGKREFDKYINENLHRPDTLSVGQRAVVVVSFLVRKDGKIDSIRIVRSPGKPFSDEAIRVLKAGPSWKPALNGDTKVEEEIRLRLVFK